MSTPPPASPASPHGPYDPDPNTPYGQHLARRRQRGFDRLAAEAQSAIDAATGKPVPPGTSHLADAGQDFFGRLEKGVREIVDGTERATRGFGRRKRDARDARKRREEQG